MLGGRQPERAASVKWGDKLENGKGVVADATLSHDAILDYNAREGRSCTFLCNYDALLDRPARCHPRRVTNPRSYGQDALS